MFIRGIELTSNEWDILLPQVDELLRQSPEFTSPTYSLKSLKSVNDLFILVKPDKKEFIDLLAKLKLQWAEIEIKKQEEI